MGGSCRGLANLRKGMPAYACRQLAGASNRLGGALRTRQAARIFCRAVWMMTLLRFWISLAHGTADRSRRCAPRRPGLQLAW
jgi:hypothetical protein